MILINKSQFESQLATRNNYLQDTFLFQKCTPTKTFKFVK